jgi:c-di-GMP-binding flagellar brake protein YcgR
MITALDLTQRQSGRLLEQAIRAQAPVDIEPRNFPDGEHFAGFIAARSGSVLTLQLGPGAPRHFALPLVGAFCEVRAPLGGQVFLFTTCVLDVVEAGTHTQLLTSMPEIVQVANRRRHERTSASVACAVVVSSPTGSHMAGVMENISPTGMACSFADAVMADLWVGDDVQVAFELAGFDETYELSAIICNKTHQREKRTYLVGLEFKVIAPADRESLNRMRGRLNEIMIAIARQEGAR